MPNRPTHYISLVSAEWYLQQLAASDALLCRLRYGALAPPLTAAEQLQARRQGCWLLHGQLHDSLCKKCPAGQVAGRLPCKL